MPVDLEGLVTLVGTSESDAGAAVDKLGPKSTAGDLQRVAMVVAKYQIAATTAAQILKSDADAKSAPARAIGSR